jgi:hypothetical protein
MACTLICGGWGGTLVGLSSIDDLDASENPTATIKEFKEKTWYDHTDKDGVQRAGCR